MKDGIYNMTHKKSHKVHAIIQKDNHYYYALQDYSLSKPTDFSSYEFTEFLPCIGEFYQALNAYGEIEIYQIIEVIEDNVQYRNMNGHVWTDAIESFAMYKGLKRVDENELAIVILEGYN